MSAPASIRGNFLLIKYHWKKMFDREVIGPTWDPERQAWWILMDLGDDIECDEELHRMFDLVIPCDKDQHRVAIGFRFTRSRRNHGAWTDGRKCRVLMDDLEIKCLGFGELISLMSGSTKFGPVNQSAASQSTLSSTLGVKKNTVIRV